MKLNGEKRKIGDLSTTEVEEKDPYADFRIPEHEEIELYDENGYVNQEGIERIKSLTSNDANERLPFALFPDSIKTNFLTRLVFVAGTIIVAIGLKVMYNIHWILVLFILALALVQFIAFATRYYYVSSQQFYVMKGSVTNILEKGMGSNKYLLVQMSDGASFLSFDAPLKNTPIRLGVPITIYISSDTEVSENEFGDYINSYISIEYHVKN